LGRAESLGEEEERNHGGRKTDGCLPAGRTGRGFKKKTCPKNVPPTGETRKAGSRCRTTPRPTMEGKPGSTIKTPSGPANGSRQEVAHLKSLLPAMGKSQGEGEREGHNQKKAVPVQKSQKGNAVDGERFGGVPIEGGGM